MPPSVIPPTSPSSSSPAAPSSSGGGAELVHENNNINRDSQGTDFMKTVKSKANPAPNPTVSSSLRTKTTQQIESRNKHRQRQHGRSQPTTSSKTNTSARNGGRRNGDSRQYNPNNGDAKNGNETQAEPRPETETGEQVVTSTTTANNDPSAAAMTTGAMGMNTMSPYSMGMGMGMGMGMPMGGMPMGMGLGMMGGGGAYGGYGGGNDIVSKLNQYLFGFQSLVFSLGQAMQILGMNTQALQQLYHQFTTMFDHALSTLHELQAIDTSTNSSLMTEEEIKRRRRLKALRWSLLFAISYTGYKSVRRWFRKRREFLLAMKEGRSSNSNSNSRLGYSNSGSNSNTFGVGDMGNGYGINSSSYGANQYGYGNAPSYNNYSNGSYGPSYHGAGNGGYNGMMMNTNGYSPGGYY